MTDKDNGNGFNLVLKDRIEINETGLQSPEHKDVGPSSLYGRRGDNITFHTQGAYVHGFWERMWSWVWKDLGHAFLGLLRLFISRDK